MQILDYPHSPWLVIASLCVALIAGFTGLSLTQGISQRSYNQRKIAVALAAVSLGGGIWSMHFVAMLGLQLPFLFYYDAAITLASALVAILVVGIALLILHFFKRTALTLTGAGVIVGLGVLLMHYIGMAGLQMCRALYTPTGIAFAIVASCALNIAAFWIAYGARSHRNILLGTVCFGLAVFAVHFIAVANTDFIAIETLNEVGPLISNEILAVGVVISSFMLCGAFLLSGVTFLAPSQSAAAAAGAIPPEAEETPAQVREDTDARAPQIPFEKGGRTLFIDPARVFAIRAEGHYTHLYTEDGQFFCAWSITEAEKRLTPDPFIKTHRSYLINPAHVGGFERMKDNGICLFDLPGLQKVPVSRSRLKVVRAALGV
ncbi:MHYT domain-containing protein [Thalassovita mangrovi]|uniref:Carbon monoxide dehydrogenase n=1 Tax=Thalassovita mangrovi TaxID=2692236 RepID=A0A6L8LS67_9RHOB|nr:MHYT domain-containing protein [Thalassovita mangrovi]MYM55989.1 carbon monoxide dehydrogenase [Thalassovita mangrovi]